MLEFEYHAEETDADSLQRPLIRENMDLRHQRAEADAEQFRYTVFPHVINACYDRLLKDAEAARQEEERARLKEGLTRALRVPDIRPWAVGGA